MEKEVIRKQLIKSIIFNFIIFNMIFTILGIAIYSIVSKTIYKSADTEILSTTNYNMEANIIERTNNDNSSITTDLNITLENITENINGEILNKEILNPRIINIVRNSNGEIIFDGFNNDKYTKDVPFDSKNIESIYSFNIDDKYNYRGITHKLDDNIYVQSLINVDAEIDILENFQRTLIIFIFIAMLLTVLASYIVSKKSLIPIKITMDKQNEFIQNASHELKTPLSIILAKLEMLLKTPNSKIIDKSESIILTINETKRLNKLVSDLLLLSKEQQNLKLESISIDNLIEQISQPYIELAELQKKSVKLKLNYNKNINLDRDKINQVIVILLDNAIKYTRQNDKITIRTFEKEGKCNILFEDTGIGINEETTDKLFDRFYREDKARERGGTGIGLSIAKLIINLHKGDIRAKRNDPKGTIIEIKIKNT